MRNCMKKCSYCGGESPEEAKHCRGCGTAFAQEVLLGSGPTFRNWRHQPVTIRAKCYLWFGAWAGVVLATFANGPENIVYAPFFPAGLFAMFPGGTKTAIAAWMLFAPIFLGWAIYGVISILFFMSRRKAWIFFVYAIFCTLLVLNVIGCRRTLEDAAGIH